MAMDSDRDSADHVNGDEPQNAASLPAGLSVGQGVDAHRFAAPGTGRQLWLACIRWEADEARGVEGLEGDSDGDAASHALIDAMLSACRAGDIGGLFGVGGDSRGAGGRGADMIALTAATLRGRGWGFLSGSVTIVGNNPHVSARRDEAQRAMGRAAGFPVSLTATTTDRMGFTGRGEGVAAIATVLAFRAPAA